MTIMEKVLPVSRGVRTALVAALFTSFVPITAALAGEEGGGIGGSISPPAAPVHHRAAPVHERVVVHEKVVVRERVVHDRARPAGRSGGGLGGFDGGWRVISSGACGNTASQLVISGASVQGPGISGSVSPNGAIRTSGAFSGGTWVAHGRLSGSRGSGSYTRTDGCTGNWSMSRM
jgi:hypothetical protein